MMIVDNSRSYILQRIDAAHQHISEGNDHFLFDDEVPFIKGPLGSLVYRVVYWIGNFLTCHHWARSRLLSIAKKIDTVVNQDFSKLNKQQFEHMRFVLEHLKGRITKTPAREKFYRSVDEIFQKTIKNITLFKKECWSERLEANQHDAAKQQSEQKEQSFALETQPFFIQQWRKKAACNIDHASVDLTSNGAKRQVGVASSKGLRPSMEDTHIATTISCTDKNGKHRTVEVFGVFDGHGGSKASEFTKDNIAEYLKKHLELNNQNDFSLGGVCKALKACFPDLDKNFNGDLNSGTTAVVALILRLDSPSDASLGEILMIANLGDSRAVLSHEGQAIQMSEDQKPNADGYKKRITKLGGTVQFVQGAMRVNGELAVARAIGDHDVEGEGGQCCISSSPKITFISLSQLESSELKSPSWLVLGCDGLWDVASSNEAIREIASAMDKGTSLEEVAHQAVCGALHCGSNDNISVMIVPLT